MANRIVFGRVTMVVGAVCLAAMCVLSSVPPHHPQGDPTATDLQEQLGASFAQTSRSMSTGVFTESISLKGRSRLLGNAVKAVLSFALVLVAIFAYLGTPGMSPPSEIEASPQVIGRKLSTELQRQDALDDVAVPESWKLDEDERSVRSQLEVAQQHAERWQIEQAQKGFEGAVDQSLKAYNNFPQVFRMRLLKIEALTRMGRFLEVNGRPTDAIASLRRAVEASSEFAHIDNDSAKRPNSRSVLVRANAQVALARALCAAGGQQGKAFPEAARYLELALQSVAHARSGEKAHEFAPLVGEIHAQLAACSYAEAKLDKAGEQAEQAMSIVRAEVVDGLKRSELTTHIAKTQGSVKHDQGLFKEALRLYDESLAASDRLPVDDAAPADLELERLATMQDKALALAQDGRIDEGLSRLDEVEGLLKSMNAKLWARSGRQAKKFLGKHDIIDPKVWEEMARVSTTRAELLLSRAGTLHSKLPIRARQQATEAVSMLRQGDHEKALGNALNSLGNVLSAIGRITEAEAAYKEGLELLSKVFGADSPVVASLYDNLGMTADAQGEHKEALRLFQYALGIQKRTLGISNPDTAGSLSLIAAHLEKHSDVPHAQVVVAATKALESAIAAHAEGHPVRVEAEERLTHLLNSDLTTLLV